MILLLASLLTSPRTLPKMPAQLSATMDPTAEACGCTSTLIMGWCPSIFDPQEAPPVRCRTGTSSLTSGAGTLSLLQQSSASATSSVLGVSGWEQSFSLTPPHKHQLSSPGACPSPASPAQSRHSGNALGEPSLRVSVYPEDPAQSECTGNVAEGGEDSVSKRNKPFGSLVRKSSWTFGLGLP